MAEMQNPNTDGDSTVLCGANSYVEKYYLNEQFSGLPESIKQELQIMCVMYTEDIGGIILLEFMPDGRLQFKVEAEENDYLFDEIGSALKIKQYQAEKRELLESLLSRLDGLADRPVELSVTTNIDGRKVAEAVYKDLRERKIRNYETL